jgi:hypothetical protein
LNRTHATIRPADRAKACEALFTIPAEYQLTDRDRDELMAPISIEEVLHAVNGLGAHKAAGPDRLSNDFYRDWGDLLAPVLADTFNDIMRGEPPPASFAEAVIVPIPKSGDRKDALNYRPISLLQSGYKIFTKLMAHRVQRSLGKVINADQAGFVRGRALADNLSIMRAILQQAQDERAPQPADGAIVLIDFRKAYDTIDRDFLRYALLAFGYPSTFITVVDTVHAGTTARFLVNGELSAQFDIVTGIRQGCPLAPLLFLIAAETLKHALDQNPRIRGVRLRGHHQDHVHTFSAFVDDSVVYLEQRDMVTALDQTLQAFSAVSGLQAQPHKSHAIVLDTDYKLPLLGPFPVVPRGTTVTYLGVEIGITDLEAANWDQRVDKLAKRLNALSQYTTGIADRVQVINLACVPSLLFTAQFFTPPLSAQTRLDGMWRQYIWNGTTSREPRKAHKIAREILELPKNLGGMGLYDYRGATLKQAATSIIRWNARAHDKYWEAFHALLPPSATHLNSSNRIYPAETKMVPSTRLVTTASTAAAAIRLVNTAVSRAYPHPTTLSELKSALQREWTAPWRGLRWTTTTEAQIRLPEAVWQRWFDTSTQCYAAMAPELRTYWLTFPWAGNEWLTSANGAPLTATSFPGCRARTLADVDIKLVAPGLFSFRNPARDPVGMRPSQVRRVAEWISCLISNTPSLYGDIAVVQHRVYASHPLAPFDRIEWLMQPGEFLLGTAIEEKWSTDPCAATPEPSLRVPYTRWIDPCNIEALRRDTATDDLIDNMKQHGPRAMIGHPTVQHGPTLIPTLATQPTGRMALRRVVHTHIQPLLK